MSRKLKSSHNIGVCLPLIDTLCEALTKRFGHYFENESCLLASSFHPQFKLSWLPWFFDEPLEVENRLKRKMSDILAATGSATDTSSSDTDHDRDEGTSDTFFGYLFTQQKRRKSSNADRVETFLSAVPPKSIDANSFDDEGLKILFIQYNTITTLPSSATVERLFSLVKDICYILNRCELYAFGDFPCSALILKIIFVSLLCTGNLMTVHRPLTSIFHPSKGVPSMTVARLQRYALFLAGLDYDIRYKTSASHCNADSLPRLPLTDTEIDNDGKSVNIFHNSHVPT